MNMEQLTLLEFVDKINLIYRYIFFEKIGN